MRRFIKLSTIHLNTLEPIHYGCFIEKLLNSEVQKNGTRGCRFRQTVTYVMASLERQEPQQALVQLLERGPQRQEPLL